MNKKLKIIGFGAALWLTAVIASTAAFSNPLYFYPADAWTLKTSDHSCKISTQYNNGFILTIEKQKGVSNGFKSNLSLNFRQDAFEIGYAYNATIKINPTLEKSVIAAATSKQTLSVDIKNYPGLLNSLLNAPTFGFFIEGNEFNLSLVGLKKNTHSFMACSNPHAPKYTDLNANPTTVMPPKAQPSNINTANKGVLQNLYEQIRKQTGSNASAPQAPIKTQKAAAQTQPTNLISPPDKKPTQQKKSAVMRSLMAGGVDMYDDTDLTVESTMPILNSDDWTLEQATMRYQEADRQLKNMGKKLQKERAKCTYEKKELEAMLFDPQLTDERQIAKLAELEEQIRRLKINLKNQEIRYKERIQILEDQLNNF